MGAGMVCAMSRRIGEALPAELAALRDFNLRTVLEGRACVHEHRVTAVTSRHSDHLGERSEKNFFGSVRSGEIVEMDVDGIVSLLLDRRELARRSPALLQPVPPQLLNFV